MAIARSPISTAFRGLGFVLRKSYRPWPAIFWGTSLFALNVSGYFFFNSGYFGTSGSRER
ncbi:putative integral membrane protein [Babesia bovis T2Bo]|uniref:putative integral membrane protein n=1 Tax=Babesia bovis T2Bo TaxID=484906 RepID=UPI001C34DF56|nr:putative integral membrane protein [Babesia bovis T2Bo]KAG6440075.1 putative integral membrane protein [Babesia bovis T2Bo]